MGRGTEQTFLRRRRTDGPRLLDEVLAVTNASETRASTAGRPCLAPVGPAAGGGTEEQAGGRPRVFTPTCRVHTVTPHALAGADGSAPRGVLAAGLPRFTPADRWAALRGSRRPRRGRNTLRSGSNTGQLPRPLRLATWRQRSWLFYHCRLYNANSMLQPGLITGVSDLCHRHPRARRAWDSCGRAQLRTDAGSGSTTRPVPLTFVRRPPSTAGRVY